MTENGTEEIISTRSRAFQQLRINLDDLSIDQLLDLVEKNPSLLRRPIIMDDRRLQVGYNEDEIRRFLVALGSHRGWKFLEKLFAKRNHDKDSEGKFIAPVVLACMNMAKKKTGALICIQQDVDLTIYEHTGEMFNADVNARLIENIFFKNSPLHDGAMIIADNHIKAAGCILPVAQTAQLPKEMGLRHRSGLGMSLETDAIVIIVSEERGKISVAHNGKIEVNVTAEELQQILAREKEVTNYC